MTPEPQRVPPGLSHDGLRSLGVGAISYVEACAALHGRGTVEAPRIFPVRLQWKAADAKYAKAPVCGPAPGWRSADNAWQPGVPVPPRATHFGAVPSDFGLAVLDEDNDRLDDLLRIVEAAGVEYATVPTAAGWHVVIRWDYSAWGELRNANWTAGGAAGQIRGGNGWVTLWAPAALVDALPALATIRQSASARCSAQTASASSRPAPRRRQPLRLSRPDETRRRRVVVHQVGILANRCCTPRRRRSARWGA